MESIQKVPLTSPGLWSFTYRNIPASHVKAEITINTLGNKKGMHYKFIIHKHSLDSKIMYNFKFIFFFRISKKILFFFFEFFQILDFFQISILESHNETPLWLTDHVKLQIPCLTTNYFAPLVIFWPPHWTGIQKKYKELATGLKSHFRSLGGEEIVIIYILTL